MDKQINEKKLVSHFNALPKDDRDHITSVHRESLKDTERRIKDEIDVAILEGDGLRLVVISAVLESFKRYIASKINEAPAVVVVSDESVELTLESGQVRKVHKRIKREV